MLKNIYLYLTELTTRLYQFNNYLSSDKINIIFIMLSSLILIKILAIIMLYLENIRETPYSNFISTKKKNLMNLF